MQQSYNMQKYARHIFVINMELQWFVKIMNKNNRKYFLKNAYDCTHISDLAVGYASSALRRNIAIKNCV